MNRICLSVVLVFAIGCASVEKNSYVAIGGLTTGVELSRQAYVQHANTCNCIKQSQFNKVEELYEKYQSAAKLAQTAIVAYKSATVPDKASLTSVLNLSAAAAGEIITEVLNTLPAPQGNKLKSQLPKTVKVTVTP